MSLKNIFEEIYLYGLFHSAPNALLTAALIYSIINELTLEESESEESEDESDSED